MNFNLEIAPHHFGNRFSPEEKNKSPSTNQQALRTGKNGTDTRLNTINVTPPLANSFSNNCAYKTALETAIQCLLNLA